MIAPLAATLREVAHLPRRQLRPHHRLGDPQPCPACGAAHWLIGRHSAECARCGETLPLGHFITAEHRA